MKKKSKEWKKKTLQNDHNKIIKIIYFKKYDNFLCHTFVNI